ncbi:YDG domain-containing protein [Asticcacaulis tiandongensis]|uniref:YDG domain-containing protein n=1 Tax=Asticcacaulis tiandongensis TaxID=2565365 RepID=UPI001FEC001B|nr:YDG domain-containing protein [Asticcacaulis tiandongensis]
MAQNAALPQGGTVVRGEATLSRPAPNLLTIDQASQRAVIDWTDFSIGSNHQVDIRNGSGATLNRVLGGQISQIDGLLSSSGSVYIMNPNGVIVGAGGRVLAGGNFVASSRPFDTDAFMNGDSLRAQGASGGDIINQGEILSRQGSVVLIGRSVTNSGHISADNGTASLVAGDDVLLTTLEDQGSRIFVALGDAQATEDHVTQDGRITAAAASLQSAGGNIYALAGNRDNLVQATGTQTIGGQLWLSAPTGTVAVSGNLIARNDDGNGGRINVNGQTVNLRSSAVLDARGTSGGEIVVGADAYGTAQGLAAHATLADGVSLLAGGASGGGRIETSARHLEIGKAHIRAGKGGEWLLDPDDLLIDAGAAQTIVDTLNADTNVHQQTTAGGTGGSGDITVASDIIWTGTGNLTLEAFNNINVSADISGVGSTTLIAGNDIDVHSTVSSSTINITADNQLTLHGGSLNAVGDIILNAPRFDNHGANLNSDSGRWLVYTNDPALNVTESMTPDFYQYNASTGSTVLGSGNGMLFSINPNISITLGPITKTYDGTTLAVLNDSNTTVTGLHTDDSWTLDGTFSNKDAGTGRTVTGSNFTVERAGVAVHGYSLTDATPTTNLGTIDQAILTGLIVGTPSKVYNKTTTASLSSANYAFDGLAAGESITVRQAASVAYDSADAGARIVDATFAATSFSAGADTLLSNYVLPTTATGVVADDKTYNRQITTSLNTDNAALYGVLVGDDVTLDLSGATGFFADYNAEADKVVMASGFTLNGTEAANYYLIQPQGLKATINRAGLSVTGVTASNKIYDGTTDATLSLGSAGLSGVSGGDNVALSTTGASGNFIFSSAGSNISVNTSGFTLTGNDRNNYSLSQPSSLTADITPRALTLNLTGTPTKVYNGLTNAYINASHYELTGFIAGEGAAITQTSQAHYASQNAGTHTITATIAPSDYSANSGTSLANYILPTSVTGTGTITRAPILMQLEGNPIKEYDGNTTATLNPSNFLLWGFIDGERRDG